jgi:hypothetical protein
MDGEISRERVTVAALGHDILDGEFVCQRCEHEIHRCKDEDGDSYCDDGNCGKYVAEMPPIGFQDFIGLSPASDDKRKTFYRNTK